MMPTTSRRAARGGRSLVRVMLALVVAVVLLAYPGRRAAEAAPATVYFPQTGHHLGDRFLTMWREHGGLAIFGYPLSEAVQEDGLTVQYFERARFELHPEHLGTPFEVQLTLLGRAAIAGRSEPAFAPFPPVTPPVATADRVFFPATGHYLAYGFKAYWESHGGLAIFGYPVSEEFSENGRTVQYFERARFEWWPEYRGTRYEVLLGRLGADAASERGVDTRAVERQPEAPDYDPGLWRQSFHLPVLMYHRFGEPASRYQMPLWRFEQELDWLRDNGYTTVTLDQAFDALDGRGILPPRPVMITFDDGFASQWAAAAALDARGMKGVFFVPTGTRGLSDDQLRSLAERGHEIASHSISHPNLRLVSDAQLRSELAGSRAQLEAIIGRPVRYVAYPYGEVDARVTSTAQAAGYRGGLHAWGGKEWTPDKRWAEPRVEISGLSSLDEFAAAAR